ncbi:hypothetical protein [Sphaerisporangium rhizosphaerae]|uniref:Uncharacterized protein n=1 Tax=Sphaerisporangium rhizosphaerae TaxID=2269375 RepID=A0ABW2P423_9ACTN
MNPASTPSPPENPPQPSPENGGEIRPNRWRPSWKAILALLAATVTGAASTLLVDGVNSGVRYVTQPKDPFGWTVGLNPEDADSCHKYVIDHDLKEVGPRPESWGMLYGWARDLKAADGETSTVDVYVQGFTSSAVVLRRIRVVVDRRLPPAPGHTYWMGAGCGGPLEVRELAVDLDAATAVLEQVASEGTPAAKFPYSVSAESPEAFRVKATTTRNLYEWHIELDWSSQDRTGTTRIDDLGHPFRTTRAAETGYIWAAPNADTAETWCENVHDIVCPKS